MKQPSLTDYMLGQPLILILLVALLAAAAGWMIETQRPILGQRLRLSGYLGILAAGMLIVIDVSRQAKGSDAQLDLVGYTQARISGGETVIPLGADGHYHAVLIINGHEVPAMIDTGASFTSIEQATADDLDLRPSAGRLPTELSTANGVIMAHFGVARELRLGGFTVNDAEIAITPDTRSSQSVVGMNLLSKLASWRVERGELHLVPAT